MNALRQVNDANDDVSFVFLFFSPYRSSCFFIIFFSWRSFYSSLTLSCCVLQVRVGCEELDFLLVLLRGNWEWIPWSVDLWHSVWRSAFHRIRVQLSDSRSRKELNSVEWD
jgi:hypothetical protein